MDETAVNKIIENRRDKARTGLPQVDVPSRASLMRSLTDDAGHTDSQTVHAQPGEIMIPVKVQKDNPDLMPLIIEAFEKSGADPRQAVVGQGKRNPYTGNEQHGFFDFIDDVLPYIGGAVGGIFGPVGAGLGSAAGTLLSGGDIKDAAVSGIGSYAGAEFLGPALGLDGTVGSALGTSGIGGAIAGALPATALSSGLGTLGGGLLGTALASTLMSDKTETAEAQQISAASAQAPAASERSIPLPGQYNLETPQGNPTPYQGGARKNTGVNYIYEVTDRTTGLPREISTEPHAFSRSLGDNERRKKFLGGAITV